MPFAASDHVPETLYFALRGEVVETRFVTSLSVYSESETRFDTVSTGGVVSTVNCIGLETVVRPVSSCAKR